MTRRTLLSIAVALSAATAVLNSFAQNSAPANPKPVAFSTEDIAAGAIQYNRTCAQCHGRNMVNSGTTSYDLRRFPVDQVDRFMLSVNKGKGSMPSFDTAITPEQVKALWAYVGSRGGKEP